MGFAFPKDKTWELHQRLDNDQPISSATADKRCLCPRLNRATRAGQNDS